MEDAEQGVNMSKEQLEAAGYIAITYVSADPNQTNRQFGLWEYQGDKEEVIRKTREAYYKDNQEVDVKVYLDESTNIFSVYAKKM